MGKQSHDEGLQETRICIPWGRQRYPDEPPPNTSAASSGGGTTYSASEPSVDQERRCCCPSVIRDTMLSLCGMLPLFIFGGFVVMLVGRLGGYPTIKVEFVSVYVNNNNNKSDDSQVITAEWNIGFSVDDSDSYTKYDNSHIKVFDVWVLCMSQNRGGAAFKPFGHHDDDQIFLNARVDALLPHYSTLPRLDQGLTLEFEVMLQVMYKQYGFEATCKNMTVGFSPNATQGIMKGGPILCHVDDI